MALDFESKMLEEMSPIEAAKTLLEEDHYEFPNGLCSSCRQDHPCDTYRTIKRLLDALRA